MELQIDFASTRMAIIQKGDNIKFVKGVEKKEHSYVTGENVKQFCNLLKS